MTMDKETALNRAKLHIAISFGSAFISTILFSLKFSWDETIPTACTNGVNLKVNPEFFLNLSLLEQVFLLEHESYHVAFMHMARVEQRDFQTWNMATDYVINLMLVDANGVMPKGGLLDRKYRNFTSEEVYQDLLANPPPEAEDFLPDMEESTSDSDKEIQAEITDILLKAVTQAKMSDQAGTVPGEVEIFLDELLNPKLPWNVIMENYMDDFSPDDYSMRRPNRRFYPAYYLPSLYSEAVGEVAVMIDASGSVTDDQFNQWFAEIYSITAHLNPSKMTVCDFDTEIRSTNTVTSVDDLMSIKFTGRGGTDISEVMKYGAKHQPTVMIIFTDGYFDPEDIDPLCPIIWLIHGNESFTSNWGRVIEYPM